MHTDNTVPGMRYCPACRSEYRAGFEQCADCHVLLVDHLPEAPSDPPETPLKGQGLVTVATFDNPVAAEVCAGQLEAAGIDAAVNDAETLAIDPLLTPAIGGIKVQVRAPDEKSALEVLREKTATDSADSPSSRPCPYCGSSETYRERVSGRAAFLSILLLGFPLLFRSNKWKCMKCCRRFK